jgi:hypothetical protein
MNVEHVDGSFGPAGQNGGDDSRRVWQLLLAGAAGLFTWITTGDPNLAVSVASLVLAATMPSNRDRGIKD